MSNIEDKFQAFLKESLSTEDSSSSTTIQSSKHRKKDTSSDTPSQKTFWWLKGSGKLDDGSSTIQQTNLGPPPDKKQANLSTHSSISSSMAEFLEKEKMCKEGSKTSLVERNTISGSPKADTSPNADYTDDFTDDDISSIMDQLSQLAGSSLDDSGKSVDEILREAEEVVRDSSRNFRGNSSKYRTLIQTSSKESSTVPAPPSLSMPSLQLVRKKDVERYEQDPRTNVAVNPQEENSVSNKSQAALTDTGPNSVPLIHHGNVIGTADVIFQLIDEEVKNEVAAAKDKKSFSDRKSKDETSVNDNNADDEGMTIKSHPNTSSSHMIDDQPTNALKSTPKKVDSSKVPFLTTRGEPLSIVLEESLSEASIGSSTKTANKVSELLSDEGSHNDDRRYTDLEKELMKEKQKYKQLKEEIRHKESDHKLQIELLKRKTEEDRFGIEKDVFLLRAKLTDLEENKMPVELGGGDCNPVQLAKEHRLKLLESELQKQEKLIIGYQHENVKLCQDVKQLKNELKSKDSQLNASTKPKTLASNHTSVAQEHENQLLQEALKNKEELMVQLNLEIESLKNEKQDFDKSVKSLKSANSLLVAEVEKFKQLSGNVDKPVPASNKTTLALRKELDQQKLDIEKKTSEIQVLTSELEKVKGELESKKTATVASVAENKRKVETLEINLGEVQTKLEKERSMAKDYKKQREADMNRIQDLNRQVKEMERILKRNHPNSISALILTANSGEASLGTSPRIKYLENRIEQLEKELETKQIEMEAGIKTIENQYQTMKEKYDIHTADIISELATWKHDSNCWREIAEKNKTEGNSWKEIADKAKVDASVWKDTAEKNIAAIKHWKEKADERNRPSNPVITDLGKRVLSMEDLATPQESLPRSRMPVATKSQSSSGVSSKPTSTLGSLRSQPCQQQLPHRMSSNVQVVREEAHLLATIRGLNTELAGRDKTIRALEKKLDETGKTNKRLQRERENLLNRDSLFRPPKVPTTSKVDLKEVKPNNEVKETDSDMDSNTYSAAHYQALSNMEDRITALKRKNRESEVQIRLLSGELSKLNDKRLQDLEDLQEEHNTEMARVLSENSSRNSSSLINQLKAKISSQDQAITVLRKYLSQSGELQDEIVILKAERDHLESCLNVANKKLSDLKDAQSPDQQHYENLREQMKELETRHECREQRLQAIIRDLINRNNAQHRSTTSDCAVQGNSEVETLRNKLLERDQQVMQYKEELDAIIEKVHEYEHLMDDQ